MKAAKELVKFHEIRDEEKIDLKKKQSQIFHCRVKITWNSVKKSPGKPGNLLEFHFSKVLTTLSILS